jgi:hypothetical protein
MDSNGAAWDTPPAGPGVDRPVRGDQTEGET